MRTRADSALSHLKDGELCIADTKDGEQVVRWSVADWSFFYADRDPPAVCSFEDIDEWRLISIRVR